MNWEYICLGMVGPSVGIKPTQCKTAAVCQCTYLQARVSGWHCNITIVPKNILENGKCCPVFVSKFIFSCNYRLYWKSDFAIKLYVNQYFPCGVLSRCRRTKRFVPKMVQQHHVWHCMVTLSDHNNNMKTQSTNSGDLQWCLDLACVLSQSSQFLHLELSVPGKFLISVEVGRDRISFWFVSFGKYNLCSLPCQSSQGNRITFFVFKISLFKYCGTLGFWNPHVKYIVKQIQ